MSYLYSYFLKLELNMLIQGQSNIHGLAFLFSKIYYLKSAINTDIIMLH